MPIAISTAMIRAGLTAAEHRPCIVTADDVEVILRAALDVGPSLSVVVRPSQAAFAETAAWVDRNRGKDVIEPHALHLVLLGP